MKQFPSPGDYLLKWRGDVLSVTLETGSSGKGRASLRTNIGRAEVLRQEMISEVERGEAPLEKAWHDLPLAEVSPGVFKGEFVLDEVGIFSGKACFFPEGSDEPCWPEGDNFRIKVQGSATRKNNSIYSVFPRQFGSFREIKRRLDFIMGEMGFNIIQTLPPFPVPTTYAVMGEMGSPFAALDFYSVDPSLAEFDRTSTPLDQFKELIDCVHARDGRFFIDLPANHTGWASTLQTHHPEFFRRNDDGSFASPGAWGVVWEDLVELDYSHSELSSYMADVFLHWCRIGVDGFRCDAGYMIPAATWKYIVARVREEYPECVFMLEGLGGDIALTDSLLASSGLDWAYSEVFQTYDRGQFEWYLPAAADRSEKFGTLVHFAETHDNDRLAKGGERYARLRVQLAAALSWQGAWGIANGVEWFCREKIDVHQKNSLSWGAGENMVPLISKLNFILGDEPSFAGECRLKVITRGGGNTLAVVRKTPEVSGGERRLLVLANLDTVNETLIDWDRGEFFAENAFDLITERMVELRAALTLRPGEVLLLAASPARGAEVTAGERKETAGEALFHWRYPEDVRREVVTVSGADVEFSAPSDFRLELVDPATGRTLINLKSRGRRAIAKMPFYAGDGTACTPLCLKGVFFLPDGPKRVASEIKIAPRHDEAKMKVSLSGEQMRSMRTCRAILSNRAAASSQLRVGWGDIQSQYDAWLSANPDPSVPSDRLNLWARTRAWVQREGFVREFDVRFARKFEVDPAGRFARWEFVMPCGMGKSAAFAFALTLSEDDNQVRFTATRLDAGGDDAGAKVRVVFRPDIEWRSFHEKTKAFSGPEELFPKSVSSIKNGFVFRPYRDSLLMSVEGGEFHPESEWKYNIAHPEEAARGQDASGDLFSPGWISADLGIGESAAVIAAYIREGEKKCDAHFPEIRLSRSPVVEVGPAMKKAIELYVVRRDGLKTVIAGYPWFLDWGRDTFIFMRGMIAAGMIDDAVKILKAFAEFEDRGTLPNIIHGAVAGNRDTSDAPLWFIRSISELSKMRLKGYRRDLEMLKKTAESIVDNYIAGTPNGIYMDAESCLVFSPSHFTWMDTNYPACTPRVGYPVEIQALWISALKFLGRERLAEKALESLKRYFRWEHGYRDCLAAPNGESAAEAAPEDTVRPNQLFLVTLGIVEDPAIVAATEQLLVPGGIRSLNSDHPLYKGVYEGDEDTSRKPAYHNGTVWAWPFPSFAEAMARTGVASKTAALSLLAGAVENINSGTLGHMSEIADGDRPHRQKGCTAQAWSVSEFYRVGKLLGLNK